MNLVRRYLNRTTLFFNGIFYYAGFAAAVLFAFGYFIPVFITLGITALVFIAIVLAFDIGLLYGKRKGFDAFRDAPERFSNGDPNRVSITLENEYAFPVRCSVIDELPFQFQERKWKRRMELSAGVRSVLVYELTPVQRGEYGFGDINVYVKSPLRLISRRYRFEQPQVVKVYPSFVQVRKYQLLATSTLLAQNGIKRVRRLGHSLEFEQIKEYVRGDDYRTVNWAATARRGDLMVNNYTDERSQQIYCIVNKGRTMKMPFAGMTLLDYAVNAALVLSNVALTRQDRAGLITFGQKLDTFVGADKKPGQQGTILEALYKQETNFAEVDFEQLFATVRNRITQRSLLVLFTNFESVESLERELPSLKRMAHYHLLVVVFFENTELESLRQQPAKSLEDIYIKTIAEKFAHEKRLIIRELRKAGILAVMSTPQSLTVNALNKYLELKNRQSI
ncbi:MAG: cell division protein DivIC (FtsB), stabilizes FtsL against RasP cleavage [Flaviaesturariibacter sp.]|nr:cell division protein DivIC (FtsB), stabilizes FtsL against RasP cleavage [Flaviaesturariibacter sp.]